MIVNKIEIKYQGKRGRKIIVTTDVGTFTRESLSKLYTHVVISRVKWEAWNGRPESFHWCTTWASRPDLAVAALAQVKKAKGIQEAHLVEIPQEAK